MLSSPYALQNRAGEHRIPSAPEGLLVSISRGRTRAFSFMVMVQIKVSGIKQTLNSHSGFILDAPRWCYYHLWASVSSFRTQTDASSGIVGRSKPQDCSNPVHVRVRHSVNSSCEAVYRVSLELSAYSGPASNGPSCPQCHGVWYGVETSLT